MTIASYCNTAQLPIAKDMTIGPVATHEGNQSVKRVLEKQQSQKKPNKRAKDKLTLQVMAKVTKIKIAK